MATRKRKGRRSKQGAPTASGESRESRTEGADSAPAERSVLLGALLLVVASASAAMLSLSHLAGLSLPGCGFESACGRAQASAWGTVPGSELPTSHVGLAYFLSMLLAWLLAQGRLVPALKFAVRAGALVSLVLTAVMLFGGYPCPYCLLVHGANLAWWVLVERQAPGGPPSQRPLTAAACSFLVLLIGLGLLDASTERRVAAAQEEELQRSLEQVPSAGEATDGLGDEATDRPFTGRYRSGPEQAAIRIVIFSDFQCPDCKKIEMQARRLLADRDDVSVSGKHFPFNMECNARVPRTLHPNACMAARAAEAAGLLGGDEAYRKMHEWLFDVDGRFESNAELMEGARHAGVDFQALTSTMLDGSVDPFIQEDIQEAIDLGLHFTPMVFINGVELKGVFARDALLRAVDSLAKTTPEPLAASSDAPPDAATKYVEDWQQGRRIPHQPDTNDWTLGPSGAAVRIVVWGDYTSSITRELDAKIRLLLPDLPDASYSPRHYPMNQDCNSTIRSTFQPRGCAAARAVEAAGVVGGHAGFWAMHELALTQAPTASDEELRNAAANAGLDPAAVFAAMGSAAVEAAIQEDVTTGARLGAQGFPAILVNDRLVPRWRLQGADVLRRILETAAVEASD